jgi:hypothetical protein
MTSGVGSEGNPTVVYILMIKRYQRRVRLYTKVFKPVSG